MSRCKDCYTYYNKHRESQKHAKVDKSLLEIEKAYKSKENKIIGQMNRVLKKDIVVKKRQDHGVKYTYRNNLKNGNEK